MKIEQALEVARDMLSGGAGHCYKIHSKERCQQALDVLREGEQPVEVVEEVTARECAQCKTISPDSGRLICSCPTIYGLPAYSVTRANKTHTTHRRITIETVESVPVLEEIE